MMSKKYHIGIKAVIVNNGKALVLYDKNRYEGVDVPGGKVDEGENGEQALERELKEELGVTNIKIGEVLHVHEREDYDKDGIKLMLIFYKVEAEIDEIRLSDEHTSFEWVSKEDFGRLSFRNGGVKKAIERYYES